MTLASSGESPFLKDTPTEILLTDQNLAQVIAVLTSRYTSNIMTVASGVLSPQYGEVEGFVFVQFFK